MLKASPFANKIRILLVLLAPLPVAALALSAWISPKTAMSLPEVCLFRQLWGIKCLGCGLIRAAVFSAHGRFSEAAALNSLIGIAFPLLIAASCLGVWLLVMQLALLFKNHEISSAVFGTHLVITLILGIVALSPLCIPHDHLLSLVPQCTAQAKGDTACPLCGMTTAYLNISMGQWAAASSENRGAIPLYLFSIFNLTLCPLFVFLAKNSMEDKSP